MSCIPSSSPSVSVAGRLTFFLSHIQNLHVQNCMQELKLTVRYAKCSAFAEGGGGGVPKPHQTPTRGSACPWIQLEAPPQTSSCPVDNFWVHLFFLMYMHVRNLNRLTRALSTCRFAYCSHFSAIWLCLLYKTGNVNNAIFQVLASLYMVTTTTC